MGSTTPEAITPGVSMSKAFIFLSWYRVCPRVQPGVEDTGAFVPPGPGVCQRGQSNRKGKGQVPAINEFIIVLLPVLGMPTTIHT